MALDTVTVTIGGKEKDAVSVVGETDVILTESVTPFDLAVLEAVQGSEPVQEDGETPISDPTMVEKMEQYITKTGVSAAVLYADVIVNVEELNAAYAKKAGAAGAVKALDTRVGAVEDALDALDGRVSELESAAG